MHDIRPRPQGPCPWEELEVKMYIAKYGVYASKFPRTPHMTTTYQKAFILRPFVQCKILFHSMISDPRVLGQGWGSRSESSASSKYGTSVFSRQRLIRKHSYLDNRFPVGLVLFPWHRTPVFWSENSIFRTS